MCSQNQGTIKEVLVQQYGPKRSQNKEHPELGLVPGSCLKNVQERFPVVNSSKSKVIMPVCFSQFS